MEPRGYDYGGDSGAGGKIRRLHVPRAAAASPYARPAPAPAPAAAAAASRDGGWFSRIIAAGASRLLPPLFRKPPPQLTAPAPPPPMEPLEEPPSRNLPTELCPELLDAPPSPLPPPLEDDLPEGEENSAAIANDDNLCTKNLQSSTAEKEDMLRNSGNHCGMDLEELLKQRTFTRSEFEYLAELLWSRTIGSSSLKPEDDNIRKMPVSQQENGSRHSSLNADFSITPYSVADQVASPAEIAKAYMSSKSAKGSPLRLRLHDPSSIAIKSMEASIAQNTKPPTIPLLQSSRFHNSKTSDHFESNYTTPNRSAISNMSSSRYFKSGVSSKDLFSTVSPTYQTLSSVHTFGRQVLKRKSSAVINEIVSVGPIRRMHQRHNRTSPLLETRPGYRKYLGGHGSKINEGSEQTARNQKRCCLDKVGDATLGNDTAHVICFGQAPVQSAEMAAKILKQLDTIVPAQKEDMSEIKQKHENAMDVESLMSRGKEVSAQRIHLEPSPSDVKERSLPNGSNGTARATAAPVTEKIVDATSNKFDNVDSLLTTSLRSHAPPNLVLSNEIDRNKMPIPSNGFTFPVTAVLGAQSQAPPTPTLASPPILSVEKQQPSAVFSASNTSMESHSRISQSVLEEGSAAHKFDNNLSADDEQMPSKNSGQGASFTSNPVFKVVNSKPTSLSNGPGHMSNSTVSAIQPSNGLTKAASFQCAGSTISTSPKSTQSSSTGGSFTFSNTAIGSSAASNKFDGTTSQSVVAPSVASSGTGSPSVPFGFSPLFGTTSSSSAQDKPNAVSSSTPYSFSQKFETASSSAPMGSVFPWASGSGSTSATAPPSYPATSSAAFGATPVSSASPMFGSKLTAASLFSPPPSAVFSFTSSTPSIPNPSPTTPFGVPAVQMAADRNGSPFPTASLFGLPSSSPSSPAFSMPATQFTSNTSSSPSIFSFGQQSQASSGGFSMGTGGGGDKSSRRIIRVKKRK